MFRTDDTLKLAAREVHLWKIPLVPDRFREESLAIFSKQERERAAGFVSEALRIRWCIGRVALRTILGRYLCCAPDSVLFRKGEHGKPSLPTTPLHFNLSHSGELALVALARDVEVGVDLEFSEQDRPFAKLIERFFSSEEAEAIRHLPPEQLRTAFYRCWTRKEALLKGVGAGISLSLKSFTVGLEGRGLQVSLHAASDFADAAQDAAASRKGRVTQAEQSNWLQNWKLYSLELPASYFGALALRESDTQAVPSSPTENLTPNQSAAWQFRYFDF